MSSEYTSEAPVQINTVDGDTLVSPMLTAYESEAAIHINIKVNNSEYKLLISSPTISSIKNLFKCYDITNGININSSLSGFERYVTAGLTSLSVSHAINAAVFASKDFMYDNTLFEYSHALLDSHSSIHGIAHHLFENMGRDRFDVEKVNLFYSHDPEYHLLLEIATNGFRINVDPAFELVPFDGTFRPRHHTLMNCYDHHVSKLAKAGNGLLFYTDNIPPAILSGIHFQPVHSTVKPDDVFMCLLLDASNLPNESDMPLNGGTAKQLNADYYGKPSFCDAATLFRMSHVCYSAQPQRDQLKPTLLSGPQ